MTSFSTPQQQYIAAFSKESGLDPGVVSAWVAAEEPVGATERVGASRVGASQDWLNIGITDSGPKGAGNTNWNDPVQAGVYGAKWLKGQVSIPGFGTASGGVQNIAKTAGQSPMAQIAAIKSSGWDAGNYANSGFESLYNQFKGNAPAIDPSALASAANTKVAGPGATVAPAKTTTTTTAPQIDWSSAGIQALLSSARKKIDTSGKFTASSPLGNLLYNVNSGAYTTPGSTKTTTTPATTTALANVASAKAGSVKLTGAGDINPLRHFTIGRTDQGVDANAPAGTPILAPNTLKVVHIYPNWYAGQPYVLTQLIDGPNKGKYIYVAEQIDHLPQVGAVIQQGQPIARYAASGTGIEIGWGTSGWQTQAQAEGNTGDSSHNDAPAGIDFAKYLHGLK